MPGAAADSRRLRSTLVAAPVFFMQTAEYDIALLYMVSVYCFVTKACARRRGAAASVERRRLILLAGAAGELAGATRL